MSLYLFCSCAVFALCKVTAVYDIFTPADFQNTGKNRNIQSLSLKSKAGAVALLEE